MRDATSATPKTKTAKRGTQDHFDGTETTWQDVVLLVAIAVSLALQWTRRKIAGR